MTFVYLISILIIIWAIIYPITDYWLRWFSPVVLKRGRLREPKIGLTFDDGPNPEITTSVLDILAQNRVPATFFLVGKRAELSPELVKQISVQGHEIGLHTYHHHHAYGMFLKKSIATISQGKAVLERIIDRPITWFRPPWGAMNLFELLEVKRLKLKVVLWTANAIDWDIRTTPVQIIERITKKITPGCIIVIHDAGGDPGAPQNMLKALPELIKQCQTKGYRFETLTNITGGIV
jgi:peptidoglycan/xylan/chitin deacetylase (PgdA/CDA1 family)